MRCHTAKLKQSKPEKNSKGNQRFKCKRRFQEEREQLLGNMYLNEDKAILYLTLLLEGMSIRSIERTTGVAKQTIINLQVIARERCENLMRQRIKGVPAKDVEADEVWGFIKCKNRHKLHHNITDPTIGDAYTFVAIERNTKLILTWHLDERDMVHCQAFTEKLDYATSGRFQLTTDGYRPYESAVSHSLGTRVDYAMLIRIYGNPDSDGEHKYSPPGWWT